MLNTRRRTATPNRVAQVNAYVKTLGLDAKLRRGQGYYYWTGADGFDWPSEYVYSASDLTLDEWKAIVADQVRDTTRQQMRVTKKMSIFMRLAR